MLLLSGMNVRILRGLEKCLFFATGFIAVFLFVCVLAELKIVPPIPHLDWIFSQEEMNAPAVFSIMISEGYTETAFPALVSLPLLVPFLMAAALSPRSHSGEGRVPNHWICAARL